jgi:hypothetical protein
MIRHDDKSEKKEWMQSLNSVEGFYRFTSRNRIEKNRLTFQNICRHKHDGSILDSVDLGHATILVIIRNRVMLFIRAAGRQPRSLLIGKPFLMFCQQKEHFEFCNRTDR